MSESPEHEPPHEFPGRKLAVRLGGAFLVALVLVLGMVLRDNSRRSELEVIAESTAVGDTNYLLVTEATFAAPLAKVATLKGVPLYPVGDKRHDKSDLEMTKVAHDDASGLTIYQAPPKSKEGGEKEAGAYFVKIGPGEYVKVRPGAK